MYRSTQLFLHCSGGESSPKCVCPALKMEASIEGQRGVLRFLVAESAGTREIHHRMSVVYDKYCMSLTSVHEWQKRFREERTSLQGDSHPGQVHRAITSDVIARINALTQENRRITEEQIRVQVDFSHGSVHAIIQDHLQFRKIYAQWVPHQLTKKRTIDRVAAYPSNLQRYNEEEYAFLSHIVTLDETWCHHFEPGRKRQSQQ